MRNKQLKEAKIENFIYPNLGIAYINSEEVRIKNAIPNEEYLIKTGKSKNGIKMGKKVELTKKSDLYTQTGCPKSETCGGCLFQNLSYQDELSLKREGIKKLFHDHGYDIEPVFHENPKPQGYRNKMEYTFGDEYKGGPLVLGLHHKNKFFEIVDNYECNIVHPDFDLIRKKVMTYFREKGEKHYRKMSKDGKLRHLVLRYAHSRGEILVNLVSTWDLELNKEEFIKELLDLKLEGNIKSIIHTLNDDPADTVTPEKIIKLYGQDYITEELLGLQFKISPYSFFQPNVYGIKNLYSKALEIAGDLDGKRVYDLYSGTGTITQIMALACREVTGIEIVEEAVEAAKENARLNKITNANFIAGDVLKELDALTEKPELIVLDPPRSGINPNALKKILSYRPENFIYISCNPKSLASDLTHFETAGYKINQLEFFDQFTRTYHVEALTLLTRD